MRVSRANGEHEATLYCVCKQNEHKFRNHCTAGCNEKCSNPYYFESLALWESSLVILSLRSGGDITRTQFSTPRCYHRLTLCSVWSPLKSPALGTWYKPEPGLSFFLIWFCAKEPGFKNSIVSWMVKKLEGTLPTLAPTPHQDVPSI